jgi:hypothetical protein
MTTKAKKAKKVRSVPVYLTINGRKPRCIVCKKPMLTGHRVNKRKDAWKFEPVNFPPVEMQSKEHFVGGQKKSRHFVRRFAHAGCLWGDDMTRGTHRRKEVVGEPMMVKLPRVVEGGDWYDSGEGGLAFFLLVKSERLDHSRCVCCVTGPLWGVQDVCFNKDYCPPSHYDWPTREWHMELDAALLIGSTGLSLWSDKSGRYFQPKYGDLTDDGKTLFRTLETMYGTGCVDIVTLLDT